MKTTETSPKTFKLPALPYAYDALEPHIDQKTMQVHYEKHHQGYVDKLNKALEDFDVDEGTPVAEILSRVSQFNDAVRNNGGGHYNHSLFWALLSPEKKTLSGKLSEAIDKQFKSFDNFKKVFTDAATSRFGSGWAWLVVTDDRQLKVGSTPNQDSPVMDVADFRGTPILGLDVWEHAYYLKHQSNRAAYVDAFWSVVDWDKVEELYEAAMQ